MRGRLPAAHEPAPGMRETSAMSGPGRYRENNGHGAMTRRDHRLKTVRDRKSDWLVNTRTVV